MLVLRRSGSTALRGPDSGYCMPKFYVCVLVSFILRDAIVVKAGVFMFT